MNRPTLSVLNRGQKPGPLFEVKSMKRPIIYIVLILTLIPVLSYGNDNKFKVEVGGAANIVIDAGVGRIMYGKNIHNKLPMASTTKIMTALLAIENIDLDKKIKIYEGAEGIEGSSIYLRAKEEVKARDLIYGLMLRSGNDSAVAIAYEVSGSVEEFARLMNERAKQIGAKNTNFVNPHGLHDDNHYTSAYDLALITREAFKNPVFKEVVKTKFWLAERDGYKHFANKNNILNICEGGDGVKTGYTMRAGRCLVASATRGNMQLIAVTLNDYDWFNTTKKLLDEGFNIYRPHTLFKEGQVITQINVIDGKRKELYLKSYNGSIVPLVEGEEEKLLTVFDIPKTLHAPVEKGQKVGKITTYLDGEIINTTTLIASETVERQTFKDRVRDFLRIGI